MNFSFVQYIYNLVRTTNVRDSSRFYLNETTVDAHTVQQAFIALQTDLYAMAAEIDNLRGSNILQQYEDRIKFLESKLCSCGSSAIDRHHTHEDFCPLAQMPGVKK